MNDIKDDDDDDDDDGEEDVELDCEWINKFEKDDNEYEDLYTTDVCHIKIHFIYVNKSDEVERIQTDRVVFKNPNIIYKEEITEILKSQMKKDYGKGYMLSYMLKYNFDLKPCDVRNYLSSSSSHPNSSPHSLTSPYLTELKSIDDIAWNKTISMFQHRDMNDIFIFFKFGTEREKKKQTNRFTVKSNNQTLKNKITFNNNNVQSHRKTQIHRRIDRIG